MKKSWILVGLAWLLALAVYQSPLWRIDPTLASLCVVGSILSVGPFIRWILGGLEGIPAFEVFSGLHLIYYFNSFWIVREDVMAFDPAVRVLSVVATLVFLLAGIVVFYWLTAHGFPRQFSRSRLLDQILPHSVTSIQLWALLLVSWVFTASLVFGFSPNWGSLFNTIRAICNSCGLLGVFLLVGALRGASPVARSLFWVLVLSRTLMEWSCGFLVNGGFFLGTVYLAILLQQRRMPYFSIIATVVVMSFLHQGKEAMRQRFWDGETQGSVSEPPWVVFPYWIAASWEAMESKPATRDQDAAASMGIFNRASLGVYLSRVVELTPASLPYLDGLTYQQFVPLIVPRFLNPNKPNGNLPVETLAIYYGVLTVEGSQKTSVALGLVAEGWANFGWYGLVLEGGFFGLCFTVVASFSRGRVQHSIGYVLGLGFLGQALNLETAVASWMVQALQALGVTFVVVYVMARMAEVKYVRNEWATDQPSLPAAPSDPPRADAD